MTSKDVASLSLPFWTWTWIIFRSKLAAKTVSKTVSKTVARSIGKVASKAVKVGARKAATSSTAKKFAKKAAKKGIEKAFEAGSEYVMKEFDSLGNTAINRKNTGADSLKASQKKKKKRNIKRHSLHSPSLRRKLKFVDNDDDCYTSPIIIYIYP